MRTSAPGLTPAAATTAILFEGRTLPCRAGDSVASALVDAGELACRETPAGDARGVFCGMGVCQECLVSIDGVAGQRACMTPVTHGMEVRRQPAYPALSASAEPHAHGMMDPRELAPDVLVIGAGPAGLAAAAIAAEAGVEVLLLDERSRAGGQYYKQPSGALDVRAEALDAQYRAGRALIGRVRRAGVEILSGAQVWAAWAPDEIAALGHDGPLTLRPRRLVLATGAYERGVPMPGWTLPGVMTTGAAQTLLRSYGVAPGRRVLVSGNGPLNMQVAAELVRGGAQVVALADVARATHPSRAGALARMLAAAPGLIAQGVAYQRALRRASVPVLWSSAVVRIEGERAAERAVVARLDGDGRPVGGTERAFDVDAVCMGFGFLPSNELARTLGCAHEFDEHRGHLTVVADRHGRTSVDDVWVVGDAGGIGGARLAEAAGALAGGDAARSLAGDLSGAVARELRRARRARRRSERFQAGLWRLYAAPRLLDQLADAETPVCRCESVSLAAVRMALDDGIQHIGALKRASRAGMGGCQGRYCAAVLTELAARRGGRPLEDAAWFAPNAPVKPAPIGALAAGSAAGARADAPEEAAGTANRGAGGAP